MTGELLGLLAAHLALTALPMIAAALFAARCGVRRLAILLAVALAVSGLTGIASFWAFYASPELGKTFSYFVVFGSILLGGWSLWGGGVDRATLRSLATPLALWALGSVFLVMLGFVHGGSATPLAMATTRFSGPLPGDSYIPNFFANWFFVHGRHGTPPVFPGEWKFSDRPPLQVGYVLSQRTFGWDVSELNYQVLGVILQQLWIVGLWALLDAARVSRLTRGLAMIVVLLSDLAIVNGFYIWPKLLPAAMLLGAAALVMTPLWSSVRKSLWGAALVATLCGLAMLGHGSSVFGIIPLALLAAYRGLPSWRWIATGVAIGVVLLGSWSAYQKYGDPPGNRVTKWSLAGVVEVDSRGTLEATRDAYAEAGVGGTIHNKAENFATIAGGGSAVDYLRTAFDNGGVDEVLRGFRTVGFYYMLPSLGLLLLAPILMLISRWRGRGYRWRQGDWSFALVCFLVFAVGTVVWGLLLFGNEPDRTVIHVSSYMLPILAMVGAVAGMRASFPRFAVAWVGLQAFLSLVIYAPSLNPPAGTAYSVSTAAVAVLAMAGFAWLALRGDGIREPVFEPLAQT